MRSQPKLTFLNRFIVYVWTGETDAKMVRVDANFFENRERKLHFQTNTDTCGQGAMFGTKFLQFLGGENQEKKLNSVRELFFFFHYDKEAS